MTPLSPHGMAALVLSQEYGYPVTPLVPRTKTPLLRPIKYDGTDWDAERDDESTLACAGGFHRATTHPDAIAEQWTAYPDANIGVRLGSHLHLCMAEADTDEAGAHLEQIAKSFQPSPTFHSRRGTNRLFTSPADIEERPVRNLWPETFRAGVEFKNGRGYFAAPPSIHPSGHQYRWADGLSPADVDLAPLPDIIADEVRRVDQLRRDKLQREDDDARAALEHHRHPRPDITPNDDRLRQVYRVQRYLETFPSAMSDGRKTAAYRLAAALVTRLEIAPADTLAVVEAWNGFNQPPLSPRIIRNVVRNACRYAGRSVAA